MDIWYNPTVFLSVENVERTSQPFIENHYVERNKPIICKPFNNSVIYQKIHEILEINRAATEPFVILMISLHHRVKSTGATVLTTTRAALCCIKGQVKSFVCILPLSSCSSYADWFEWHVEKVSIKQWAGDGKTALLNDACIGNPYLIQSMMLGNAVLSICAHQLISSIIVIYAAGWVNDAQSREFVVSKVSGIIQHW